MFLLVDHPLPRTFKNFFKSDALSGNTTETIASNCPNVTEEIPMQSPSLSTFDFTVDVPGLLNFDHTSRAFTQGFTAPVPIKNAQ